MSLHKKAVQRNGKLDSYLNRVAALIGVKIWTGHQQSGMSWVITVKSKPSMASDICIPPLVSVLLLAKNKWPIPSYV